MKLASCIFGRSAKYLFALSALCILYFFDVCSARAIIIAYEDHIFNSSFHGGPTGGTNSNFTWQNLNHRAVTEKKFRVALGMPSVVSEMAVQYGLDNYNALSRQIVQEVRRKSLHQNSDDNSGRVSEKEEVSFLAFGDTFDGEVKRVNKNSMPPEKKNFGGIIAWEDEEKMGLVNISYQSIKKSNSSEKIGFNGFNLGIQGSSLFIVPTVENLQIGAYAAISQGHSDVSHHLGSTDTKTWKLGPMATWKKDEFSCVGVIAYGNETVSQHYIGEKADYRRSQWDFFGYSSYDFDLSDRLVGLVVSPELQLMYTNHGHTDFYAPWTGSLMSTGIVRGLVTRMGVLANCLYDGFQNPVILSVSAGWQYNKVSIGDLEVSGVDSLYSHKKSADNAFYYSWEARFPIVSYCELGVGIMGTLAGGGYSSYQLRGVATFSF